MSKKVKIIAAIIGTAILAAGAGAVKMNDSQVADAELTKEQEDTQEKIKEVYQTENQQAIAEELEQEKSSRTYTEDQMLVKYNPFGTNTQSLYVYFTTEEPVSVSYTIHVDDTSMEDFTQQLYAEAPYQMEHEYQVMGLIPDTKNQITFTMTREDGTSYTKEITYQMESLLGEEPLMLTKEEGKSTEQLENGLYVVMGNDSESLDFMYYYDNYGILRGEVPLIGYRSHRLLFSDDKMYYSISETKMAEVNRLGQVTNVYDLGNYELHHDYVFDDNGDMLILASDTTQDSVEDIIVKLNTKAGTVEEILDLEYLFGDYKTACEKNSEGELDWMHINTLQWTGNDSIIISSRETSSILKITDLYSEPKVDYIISDENFWEGTSYENLVLAKDGTFSSQAGQHSVTYVEEDGLEEGQYYLYMFDNNIGVSESRPDYDWSVIEGVQSEAVNGDASYYYKYLVDESASSYQLVDSFAVPYSGYVSSAQDIGNNTVTDSGFVGMFGEYDADHILIQSYTMPVEKFIYRVYKYTFGGFYFS